jgi:hypothetical protein
MILYDQKDKLTFETDKVLPDPICGERKPNQTILAETSSAGD